MDNVESNILFLLECKDIPDFGNDVPLIVDTNTKLDDLTQMMLASCGIDEGEVYYVNGKKKTVIINSELVLDNVYNYARENSGTVNIVIKEIGGYPKASSSKTARKYKPDVIEYHSEPNDDSFDAEAVSKLELLTKVSNYDTDLKSAETCELCLNMIFGIRYKCNECLNYNLCSLCIRASDTSIQHTQGHRFYRIEDMITSKSEVPALIDDKTYSEFELDEYFKIRMDQAISQVELINRYDTTEDDQMYHLEVKCMNCHEEDIVGFRFKCSVCMNYDLCEDCYHTLADYHTHFFMKIANSRVRSGAGFVESVYSERYVADLCALVEVVDKPPPGGTVAAVIVGNVLHDASTSTDASAELIDESTNTIAVAVTADVSSNTIAAVATTDMSSNTIAAAVTVDTASNTIAADITEMSTNTMSCEMSTDTVVAAATSTNTAMPTGGATYAEVTDVKVTDVAVPVHGLDSAGEDIIEDDSKSTASEISLASNYSSMYFKVPIPDYFIKELPPTLSASTSVYFWKDFERMNKINDLSTDTRPFSEILEEKTNQVYASLSLGPNREIDYELLNHLAAEDKDVTSAANDKDITSAEDMRFDDYDDDFMSPVRCKQSGLDRFLNEKYADCKTSTRRTTRAEFSKSYDRALNDTRRSNPTNLVNYALGAAASVYGTARNVLDSLSHNRLLSRGVLEPVRNETASKMKIASGMIIESGAKIAEFATNIIKHEESDSDKISTVKIEDDSEKISTIKTEDDSEKISTIKIEDDSDKISTAKSEDDSEPDAEDYEIVREFEPIQTPPQRSAVGAGDSADIFYSGGDSSDDYVDLPWGDSNPLPLADRISLMKRNRRKSRKQCIAIADDAVESDEDDDETVTPPGGQR